MQFDLDLFTFCINIRYVCCFFITLFILTIFVHKNNISTLYVYIVCSIWYFFSWCQIINDKDKLDTYISVPTIKLWFKSIDFLYSRDILD